MPAGLGRRMGHRFLHVAGLCSLLGQGGSVPLPTHHTEHHLSSQPRGLDQSNSGQLGAGL